MGLSVAYHGHRQPKNAQPKLVADKEESNQPRQAGLFDAS